MSTIEQELKQLWHWVDREDTITMVRKIVDLSVQLAQEEFIKETCWACYNRNYPIFRETNGTWWHKTKTEKSIACQCSAEKTHERLFQQHRGTQPIDADKTYEAQIIAQRCGFKAL